MCIATEKLKKVKAKCGRKEQSDVTQGNQSENHDSDELFSQPRLQEETGSADLVIAYWYNNKCNFCTKENSTA